MNTEIKLRVTEVQRFCMHDGPGVRTTVFLKGCPLHCKWCHNPETQKSGAELLFYPTKCIGCGGCAAICPHNAHGVSEVHTLYRKKCTACGECARICPTGALEISGEELSVGEILSLVERDKAFYGKIGGVTLSGGEPFAQKERTLELLKALRERGFSTAVETSGYAERELILSAVPYTDLFLWDLKDTDEERHRANTGVPLGRILENLAAADAVGARTRLRCILVNGVNTNADHYRGIAEVFHSLSGCEGVELIPYHAYGGTKAVFLGGEDNGRRDWIPDGALLEEARAALAAYGVTVI